MKRTARHTKEGKIAVIVGITMVAIFLCLGVGMALAKTDDRGSLGMKNNPEHGIGNEFEVKSEPVRKTKVTAAGETVTKSVYLRPGEDGQLLVEFYGEGTVDNPYQVSSPEQLDAIRVFMAGGSGPDGDFVAEKSAHYIQTNDIDLKDYIDEYYGGPGGPGWLPLGKSDDEDKLTAAGEAFDGLYDGDGYQIQNLRINRPGMSEVGLFARSGKHGTKQQIFFKNIILRDVEISAGFTGLNSIGALVGYLDSNGVVFSSAVKGDSRITGNGQRVGGLVGYSLGRIINSYSQAQVQGNDEIGGLVGRMQTNNARVEHSYAAGSVLPLADNANRGGLVGIVNNGAAASITASYYDKDIAEKSDAGKGVGLSTADMKKEESYLGWAFDHIWAIDSVGHLIDCESEDRFYLNGGYPYLLIEKEYQDLEEVVCPGEPEEPENPEVSGEPEDPEDPKDPEEPEEPEEPGSDGDDNLPIAPEVPGAPEEEEKDENDEKGNEDDDVKDEEDEEDDNPPVNPETPGEPEEEENDKNNEKGNEDGDEIKDEEDEEDDTPPIAPEETGDGVAEDYSSQADYSGGSSPEAAHEIIELIEIDKLINEIALDLEGSSLFALSLPEDERLTAPDFQAAANYRMVMPDLSNLPGVFVWDGRSWQGIALLAGPVQAGAKEVPSVTVSTADGLLASNKANLTPALLPLYKYDFIDADLLTGAMDYMASRQMIRGYQASDYSYLLKADQSASRAEFLVIMLRSLGLESLLEINSEGLLTGGWYEDYVVLAEKLGLLAASSTLNPAAEDLDWSSQDWNQSISLAEAQVLMSNLETLPLYQDYLTLRKTLDEKGLVYQIGLEVVNTPEDNQQKDYLTRGRAVEFIYQEIFSKS